jgi:hypothetical protein
MQAGPFAVYLLPFTFSRLSFPGIIRRDVAGMAA